MRRSSDWSSRRRPPRRRSSGQLTVSRSSSFRSPCCWPAAPGWSAVTPPSGWPYWWWPRRARCCWRRRSRSCPGCPGRPAAVWWSRVERRWNALRPAGYCCSTRPARSPAANLSSSDIVLAGTTFTADQLSGWAAGLDQVSPHVLAGAIVKAARARRLSLAMPQDVVEHAGYGIEGRLDGRVIRLGKASWIVEGDIPAWGDQVRRRAALNSALTVFISVDGEPAGAFLLEDPIRPARRRPG